MTAKFFKKFMCLLPAVILSTSCTTKGSSEPVSTAITQQATTQAEVQTEAATNPTTISQEEVLSFLKEQYDINCTFSDELPEFSLNVTTNDHVNPDWMWNIIRQKEDYQGNISNYAAYWEVEGLPDEASVLWHLANCKTFAVSERYTGEIEYWDYTGNHKYLYTGRCKNRACYCYAMYDSGEWTKHYINVDGIFVVYNNVVYRV